MRPPGPVPPLPKSAEREAAVLWVTVFVLVLGAVGMMLYDAGSISGEWIVVVLAAMTLLLFIGPAALETAIRVRRDRARISGREFDVERVRKSAVAFLVLAAIGAFTWLLFFAKAV